MSNHALSLAFRRAGQCLRALCAMILLVVFSSPASGQVQPAEAVDAGCADANGATGYYRVHLGSTPQWVLVRDTNGDELPDYARCIEATGWTAIGSSNASSCVGLTTLPQATTLVPGCAFPIQVYKGSNAANTANCSAADGPMLMFGGPLDDDLIGTDEGDAIHGGSGDDALDGDAGIDLLCGGEGNENVATAGQAMLGGPGADLMFGGPDLDDVQGETGDDLAQGSADEDDVDAGDGNDHAAGGPHQDEVRGGADDDAVHSGKGVKPGGSSLNDVMEGDDDDDILFAQDMDTEQSVDGNAGTDECWVDSGNAACAENDVGGLLCSVVNSCTTTNRLLTACPNAQVMVGTQRSGTTAYLYELNDDGSQVANTNKTLVWNDGIANRVAERLVGMAVDPTTCLLWVMLEHTTAGPTTVFTLGTVNLGAEPAGGGTANYDVSFVADFGVTDLVDLAFGPEGSLVALQSDGDLHAVNKSTAALTSVGFAPIGRSGVAYHLAFDNVDAGYFFATTENEEDSTYMDLDGFEAYTEYDFSVENHIDPTDMPNVPFTMIQAGAAGQFLWIKELEDDPYYEMWQTGHRNFGHDTDPWTADGACGGACPAAITTGDTVDSITTAHWMNLGY